MLIFTKQTQKYHTDTIIIVYIIDTGRGTDEVFRVTERDASVRFLGGIPVRQADLRENILCVRSLNIA